MKRKILCIVDGIVGGQGNGPLDPTPMQSGIILAGMNPIVVDLACARLMGFDYKLMPILDKSLGGSFPPLFKGEYKDINCKSNNEKFNRALCDFEGIFMAFEPHFGWRNHIELDI